MDRRLCHTTALRKMLKNQRFDNVAAAAQLHLEDIMKKWISNAIKKTGIKKIVCAGGVFLNVKMNMVIRKYLQDLSSVNDNQKGQILYILHQMTADFLWGAHWKVIFYIV